jgi:hypothetical protein
MSDSGLAIAGFYDHEQQYERAPDWGGDDVFAPAPGRRFERERYLEPAPMGRRTVTITGRPGGMPVARRPNRTIDERLAHRPERVASWACAMGFLLILLAVLTAH